MSKPREPDEALSTYDLSRNVGAALDRVRVGGKHILATRNGKPAAVLVPFDWWQIVNGVTPAVPVDEHATVDEGANDAA